MSRLKNGDVLLRWPLNLHVITAGWTYNSGAAHGALDFRTNQNGSILKPVYAAEDGIVSLTYNWNGKVTQGDTNSYGNMVKLKHANYGGSTLETLYAHLSSICVKKGQVVQEGDIIGYSGDTGNCYGAHLHFEVRWGGKRSNPLYWLDADFVCASPTVEAHLGSYTSVVPDTVATPPELYTITVGPMSAGDRDTMVDMAEKLGLTYSMGA